MNRIDRIQRIGTTHPAPILSPLSLPLIPPILSILFPLVSGMLAPLLGPATGGEGPLP